MDEQLGHSLPPGFLVSSRPHPVIPHTLLSLASAQKPYTLNSKSRHQYPHYTILSKPHLYNTGYHYTPRPTSIVPSNSQPPELSSYPLT